MHIRQPSNVTTRYEQLADELAAAIQARVVFPGERLPSIRRLAQQKHVSISTVLQALRLLEDRGLVEARPQAGYFVRLRTRLLKVVPINVTPQAPAPVGVINLLGEIISAHATEGRVRLGAALPMADLLPVARLQRCVASVARCSPALFANYGYFEANETSLVRQILRRSLEWGHLDPEQLIVTGSCTEAISLCLRAVTQPGDTVAIESATFFVLLQVLESLGLKALEIPTDPMTGVSVPALELAMREGLVKACLFIPNANNPTGSIMPETNKRQVAALAARYDVAVIEDDIYRELCFTSQQPWPIKAYDVTGHVMLCSSFAKILGPAVRVGYAAAGKYAARVAFLKTVSSGSTSCLNQAAVAEFIGGNGFANHMRKMRREMSRRIAAMTDAVEAAFPEQTQISSPQGGFVLWIELPSGVDALTLHAAALKEGIAFMPGPVFSASGSLRNHLRLNCANVVDHQIQRAVIQLGALVRAETGL